MDKYASLKKVLVEAEQQASQGKGKERHADDLPFEEQEIVRDAIYLGQAAPIFQVRKKAKESLRLSKDAAIRELYGVIIYAAAAIIALKKGR